MTIRLDDQDSVDHLDGGWKAIRIEREIEDDLFVKGIMEPVIVLYCDDTVAFYLVEATVL